MLADDVTVGAGCVCFFGAIFYSQVPSTLPMTWLPLIFVYLLNAGPRSKLALHWKVLGSVPWVRKLRPAVI